jgi:hypothetical protein
MCKNKAQVNKKRVNLFNDSSNPNFQYKFPISFLKLVFETNPEIEHLYEGPHIQAKGKGINKVGLYNQSYCQLSKWIC